MLSPNRNTHQHPVVSREEWIEARKAHLKNEKALTRMRDMVSAERRELPWVKIEKEYVFDTPAGKKTLAELFGNNSQLIVYHFMWRWDLGQGCNELLVAGRPCRRRQCAPRAITTSRSSRSRAASLPDLEAYRKRMGWQFDFASSYGSDFNFDYHVSFTDGADGVGQALLQFRMDRREIRPQRAARRQRLLQGRKRRHLSHLFVVRARPRHRARRLPLSSTSRRRAATRPRSWNG